jgi:pimeloyl-ACP methyl ester carboxylesterase
MFQGRGPRSAAIGFAFAVFLSIGGNSFAGISTPAIREAVVLVPGTFNSVAVGGVEWDPVRRVVEMYPYFSEAIVNAVEKQGYPVYVIRGLAPFGKFEQNGDQVIRQIEEWLKSQPFGKDKVQLTLVGHSAGGFYSLYAASKNPRLPIRRIITLASPMQGMELADDVFSSGWLGRGLELLCQNLGSGFFNLEGLTGLRTPSVESFLSQLHLPKDIFVHTIAPSQPIAPSFWEGRNAKYLSILFSELGKWIGKDSDGVVSVESAYGRSAKILNVEDDEVRIHPMTSLPAPLDHTEQVLDYRVLRLLGVKETDWVHDQQVELFSRMIDEAKRSE